MSDFVHLHCHSEYSLLDGAIRLKDLCAQAKNFGMPAVALTDHGNLYGAMFFYKQALQMGIKPIIGCEVYVCPDHTDKTSERRETNHLVLLAQNLAGYHNLVQLVSKGALHGFHYRPRVDKKLLARHSEGLIALSACLAGEIPRAINRQGMEHALALVNEYRSIFPERFFLEIQVNGLPEQKTANAGLLELAGSTGTPLVATNDCHYLLKTDHEAHDLLLCVQTQTTVNDPKRMRFDGMELHFKSPEEMERDFAWAPAEVLSNSMRIADMVEDYNFKFGEAHFPIYRLPRGVTLDDEFRRLSREGLDRRLAKITYQVDEPLYRERLEMELDVIANMGYQGYFLIVQDFINWGLNNGVPVGPGRGSAAGSLVAWALRITNLDPIPYNLLFERFLNPERVSLPDIDVDFCERKRHKVIEYVTETYGADSVAQITTFGTMKAKAVVRDVGRALGMSFAETNRIAKLIPEDLKMTIDKALKAEPELETLYRSDEQIKKLIDVSRRLEGLSRHASTHAAGVVISDKPMIEYLPLYRGKREEVVTQFDKNIVEDVGLVKFDFLGLTTMTQIQDTLELIAAQGKEAPDLDSVPLDDMEAYKLYAAGDTDGIFQVESSGMRSYLRQLRPSVFEDIIAMLALYRPGPLGANMVEEFIKRKHGQVAVEYILPSLKDCLKDTYGVIVYHEQVMQIGQIVAGYSLGGADMLRRAMGKKKPELMSAERAKFVEGARQNGVDEEKASEIFSLMEKFAEYGFNKSHSAAYALVSYHTAYLKAHYKPEFMAALMTSVMGNQDKLLKYVAACKDMGLRVEAPSIQKSRNTFSVHDGAILFGLGGIKNVGAEAVREIVEARGKDGPFASLLDLCCRVGLRKVTKRVLESLIKGGAMDCLGVSRAALIACLEPAIARAQKKQKDADSGQSSLLSLLGAPAAGAEKTPGGIGFESPERSLPEWSDEVKLANEKEALGFFLTSHPLQHYRRDMHRLGLVPLEECFDLPCNYTFKSAVLVNGVKEVLTKKGDRMAFCQFSDLTGSCECVFFPKTYALCREFLQPDATVEITARVQRDPDGNGGNDGGNAFGGDFEESGDDEGVARELKLEGEAARPLLDAVRGCATPYDINLKVKSFGPAQVDALKDVLLQHGGDVKVNVVLYGPGYQCSLALPRYSVRPGPELGRALTGFENCMKQPGPEAARANTATSAAML
ncbi:MAG: DNA polymerase III subunit alpha [Deltaproteobacteria bacterium]|jgi:DNA polymerase-3 subunit alpha|nr:DNA polymerase III subunit alpha [Deltaproteobacteria bacterium]